MPFFPNVTNRPSLPLRITRFRGLNVSEDPTQLADNESPDMLNMLLDNQGAPQKRTGFREVIGSLTDSPILGMFLFQGKVLIAQGTELRQYDQSDVEG